MQQRSMGLPFMLEADDELMGRRLVGPDRL